VSFGLWLAVIGPVRARAGSGIGASWLLGSTPSLLAGFAFAHWQAFATRSGPLVSAVSAALLVTLAELIQLALPRYTADLRDVVAGIAGAALAAPILWWRRRRVP
jgi:hypothetical protein